MGFFTVSPLFYQSAFKIIKEKCNEQPSLGEDTIHYLDGVYTPLEISERLSKIHNLDQSKAETEVTQIIEILRERGLVDSFGNPNERALDPRPIYLERSLSQSEDSQISPYPLRNQHAFVYWNGKTNHWLYYPRGRMKKINQSFYENVPGDAFEALIFMKGVLSLEDISKRLHTLFQGQEGYRNSKEALESVRLIATTYRTEGLVTFSERDETC